MSMSKTEIVGWSIFGGVLGAVVVMGVAGGSMYGRQMHGGVSLPMTLEMQTNAGTPSTMHVLATVSRHHRRGSKKCMATLTIYPFKAMASGSFTAAAAMPVLPISFVPVADAAPVDAMMHSSDGTTAVKGSLAVGANGAIVLTAPAPSADKDAWGLAKPARIHYEVADM